MIDIVKCSHCGVSVTWADYSDHIERSHGNWRGIVAPNSMARRVTAELEAENAELVEQAETGKLNDEIRDLKYDLELAVERNHELQDKLDTLEGNSHA